MGSAAPSSACDAAAHRGTGGARGLEHLAALSRRVLHLSVLRSRRRSRQADVHHEGFAGPGQLVPGVRLAGRLGRVPGSRVQQPQRCGDQDERRVVSIALRDHSDAANARHEHRCIQADCVIHRRFGWRREAGEGLACRQAYDQVRGHVRAVHLVQEGLPGYVVARAPRLSDKFRVDGFAGYRRRRIQFSQAGKGVQRAEFPRWGHHKLLRWCFGW
mmetsp:Transcript_83770/g.237590  ORF Transcript_83770/g.237590 Transcript_83770/m.237590 type:complete len:216 (-) Transcript_83770:508-1155(-)